MQIKILYIATRKPWPITTGRHKMIDLSLKFIEHHNIKLLYFSREKESSSKLSFPTIFEFIVHFIFNFNRKSLQEILFYSHKAKKKINEAVESFSPDIIICDMLRTAQFVEDLKIPKILEIDDLLSLRYQRYINSSFNEYELAGTFGRLLPKKIEILFKKFFIRSILKWESKKIQQKEDESPKKFKFITTVSPRESKILAARTKCNNIVNIPPTIKLNKKNRAFEVTNQIKLLFLGNLKSNQNFHSVKYIIKTILPNLKLKSIEFSFTIIGEFDHKATELVALIPEVNLLGYVESLDDYLSSAHLLLSPIAFGTGIKTKILDAMASGLPVLTNSVGAEGLEIEHRNQALIADSFEEQVDLIIKFMNDIELQQSLSNNGLTFIQNKHNFELYKIQYNKMITSSIGKSGFRLL